jgi:hypothetical protein
MAYIKSSTQLKNSASELKAAALKMHEAIYDQDKTPEELLKLWVDVKFWSDSIRSYLLIEAEKE